MASAPFKVCAVDGCERNAHGSTGGRKGYCCSHRRRIARHGDPLGGGTGTGEARRWLMDHVSWDGDECLIWPFHRNTHGYAVINADGRPQLASRAMCKEAHGEPLDQDDEAAHSCGKGHLGCIHPDHLLWKSKVGNEADKIIHGTSNRGERQGAHKLTESDVLAIRALKGNDTIRKTAASFGVSSSTISDIHAARTWAWMSNHERTVP